MKKLLKIFAITAGIISAFAAIAAAAAFIGERIEELKNKGKALRHKPYGIYERFIKRPLDCFLSTGALVVLSPVMLVTALLVRVKLGSPVLFTQERPGRNEEIFKLYKFRTMTDERDENGALLPDYTRLTKFGKFLRNTSVDELPELLNIIKGDMAVVGPRPLLVKYLPLYNEEQRHRHDVRPGLTGLAQAHGRNNSSWEERFELDVEYTEKISFRGDIKIMADTFISVLRHEDIDSESAVKSNITMAEFTGTVSE